ncbi:hypothetical protein [Pseudomonas sp. Irchel s3b2]|uniref:hypothetical protein n=1 Tax=Pseudomonas sp. Irchel s3b2 TaxID=2009073 RepID=UPI000BA38BB8|nr:hypothetical protein [Pseudomonas sp. Irchel s3b2]
MTIISNRLKTTIDITTEQELTFDTHTGEVLVSRKEIIKRHRVTTDVGKQCRHPVDARNFEELAEILSVHDHWADNLTVEADKLLDLLETGKITAGAVRLFRQILLGLAGRNIWFGKLADIGTKREIGDLSQAGLIRVIRQGKTLPTKVTVHPWYGWRGDLASRQSYIGDWIGGIED